jgi:serine/tyrosine/threonine adenylyltransferase
MRLGLTHSYAALPQRFYTELPPAPVSKPELLLFNAPLARELGLDADALEPQAATLFSGNAVPDDARPLAMAYAGHQFGNFVPQLGDGRAILLGEVVAPDGQRRDIQLKGSGRTPFSRGGDGRAAIGPMLREYVISEAMHALGIPTTRSLAVIATGERVLRDDALPGAVLTRVAASHIRVGTFQFFAARGDVDGLRALADHVIARHYPDAAQAEVPALALLEAATERQVRLIAEWMRVGFIHGVMNTDNMALSGETIDYGPCAFMDEYHPATVFSSIDHRGRYAYANQPAIAQWNLARLAETLLPLIDADVERAVERATAVVEPFVRRFDERYVEVMRPRLGLATREDGDGPLLRALLDTMQQAQADYTLTFRRLADAVDAGGADGPDAEPVHALLGAVPAFHAWHLQWQARLARETLPPADRAAAMRRASPAYIPRNHRVEAALDAATTRGDLAPFRELLAVVQRPYDDQPGKEAYQQPPTDGERVMATFCGT